MKLSQIKLDFWLISVTTLIILHTAESQMLTPTNVALRKPTPGSTLGAVRYGNRQAVVDGDQTAFLNNSHCTGCFATQKNRFGWWSVNLGQPYFLTSVHIYVPRNPQFGNGAAILNDAATTTLVSNGPAIIDVQAQSYSDYLQIGYKRPNDSSTLTIQAVSPVRYAQYVALVNPAGGTSYGLRLAEVEVYGFGASQFVPRDLRVSSVTVSSLLLSWRSPSDQMLSITYEYGCGIGRISWTELTTNITNITRQVDNLTANTRYNCNARVKRNPTAFQPINAITDCAAPPTAEALSFGSPVKEDNDGRERWRYNVTWVVSPGYSSSCLHNTNPYKLIVDGEDIENHQSNSYTYYADGYTLASISVWTRSRLGVLSQNPLVESITTPQGLRPRFASLDLVLTSPSYDCVKLSWDPPQHPNAGPQTTVTYQHKCNSTDDWQTVPSNNRSCGYSAYQEVSCQLRVCNRYNNVDRYSDVAISDSIRTRCLAPSNPRNVTLTPLGVVYHEAKGRDQTQYRVSWNEPSETNCASLRLYNRYRVYYIGSEGQLTTNNQLNYTIHADGDTEIEVRVRAYNNEHKYSEVTKMITTAPLRPQLHPESYTLESSSSDCITLSWAPPAHPNGPITGYQYNCTDNNTWVRAGGSVAQNATRCNYLPYAEVTCQIRAENSKGFSDVDTKTMRTQCADPELPDNLTPYIVDEIVGIGDQARRQITLNLSKSIIKPNCAEIPEDGIRFGVIGGEQVATNDSIADLNATTEYQIIVVVKNNQDFTADKRFNYTTGELAPYTSPKMEIYFNSSCAFLVLSPPDEPNGILTHYQFGCDYYDDYLHNSSSATSRNVTIDSQKLEGNSKVCGFVSASRLSCWAVAVNRIGQSPALQMNGNTQPLVKNPKSPVREKRESPGRVPITFYPIELDGDRTSVSSYIVVVRKVNVLDTRKKRSVQRGCQHQDELYNSTEAAKRNQSCYITASYNVNDIQEGGIMMVVGDDSYIGGYRNTRLKQADTYEIYLAITGVFIEGGGEFILYVISVISQKCSEPLQVGNANLVSPTVSHDIGSQLEYQCEGSVISGSGVYICGDVAGITRWSGELICSGTAITKIVVGLVVPFVLIVAILLAMMLYWKRKLSQRGGPNIPEHTNNTTGTSGEFTGDHLEVDAAEYATIIELSDALSTRAEFDQVDDFRSPHDEYEQVANIRSNESSQPVYENRSVTDQRNHQHYEELQRKKESHIYDAA